MSWTAKTVELWLVEAVDVMRRLPDIEQRYLRNPLRSRMPTVVETTATAFAAAVAILELEGTLPETRVSSGRPGPREIDRMEHVILGLAKPRLGLMGETPWLNWLSEKRRRLVWRRVKGSTWPLIAALERRTERTCQRWYKDALEHIADELTAAET